MNQVLLIPVLNFLPTKSPGVLAPVGVQLILQCMNFGLQQDRVELTWKPLQYAILREQVTGLDIHDAIMAKSHARNSCIAVV